MYEVNRKMKVFSQLYVGVKSQRRGNEEEKLGFATPYEDNAAGRKRQETVDTWCRGYDHNKAPETKKVDNVPRAGFKITDDVKRVYWGGGNVVFRVYDPYGYELEIQSQNLMALLLTCGVNAGGEIPGKCLWGRDGATNVLLHEDSEEYKNAILAAESLKKPKISGGEVGLEYTLLDGSSAFYMGKFWVAAENYTEEHSRQPNIKIGEQVYEANVSSKKIEPPELYDAVYNAESKAAIFYKKAPLITPTGKKLSPKQQASWLDDDLIYASAAKGGRYGSRKIRVVSATKPTKMWFTTRHLTGREFEKQLKRVSEMRKHFKAETAKSAGQMHFFSDWPNIIALVDGNKVYSSHFEYTHEHQPVATRSTLSCLGSMELYGDRMTIVSRENMWYRTAPKYYTPTAVDALVLPQFSTVDEVIEWCNLCQSQGKFHKVIVEHE